MYDQAVFKIDPSIGKLKGFVKSRLIESLEHRKFLNHNAKEFYLT